MTSFLPSATVRSSLAALASLLIAGGLVPTAAEATVFRLTGSDVVVDQPAPLFTSNSVSGTLTLADTVKPGDSFGSAAITAHHHKAYRIAVFENLLKAQHARIEIVRGLDVSNAKPRCSTSEHDPV